MPDCWHTPAYVNVADLPAKVIRAKPGVGFSAGKKLELQLRWLRRGRRAVFLARS